MLGAETSQTSQIIEISQINKTSEISQIREINNSLPQSLAYMIYTSGSTGKPKGVMVTHKALLSYLSVWKGEAIKASDRISCHASFSFDMSIDDLYGALYAGATLHIIPSALMHDLTQLSAYLVENKITGGTYSTQLGMELLNSFDIPLRFIRAGGEKFKPVRLSDTKIINGYGPTEFTVCSCIHVVNQETDTDNIPIGRPLQNTWSYVLDDNNQLLPLTPVGKVDRKVLAQPIIELGEIIAPRNPTEKCVLDVVQSLLEITDLGVTANLFDAGLNSISAIKLVVLLQNKLHAKISYMARSNDGKFQINYNSNSFIGILLAYKTLKVFPHSHFQQQVELSPIDCTAKAVLLLAKSPKAGVVYHPYNPYKVFLGDIITIMQEEGICIRMVEDKEFEDAFSEVLKDTSLAKNLTSFIAYQDITQNKKYRPFEMNNDYTNENLLAQDCQWAKIGDDYLRKFIRGLMGLGYFK